MENRSGLIPATRAAVVILCCLALAACYGAAYGPEPVYAGDFGYLGDGGYGHGFWGHPGFRGHPFGGHFGGGGFRGHGFAGHGGFGGGGRR